MYLYIRYTNALLNTYLEVNCVQQVIVHGTFTKEVGAFTYGDKFYMHVLVRWASDRNVHIST